MTTIKSIAIALSTTVLMAANSFAGTGNPTTPVSKTTTIAAEPLKVQFIGEKNGYLYFEVKIDASNAKTANFSVSDSFEGELHTSEVSGNKIQTLKIEKRTNQELEFNLQIKNKNFSQSFNIVPVVVLSEAK
jgi:hypothetical protein